mgnify:CR=1 FL=1
MYCIRCGKLAADGTLFCANCGAKLMVPPSKTDSSVKAEDFSTIKEDSSTKAENSSVKARTSYINCHSFMVPVCLLDEVTVRLQDMKKELVDILWFHNKSHDHEIGVLARSDDGQIGSITFDVTGCNKRPKRYALGACLKDNTPKPIKEKPQEEFAEQKESPQIPSAAATQTTTSASFLQEKHDTSTAKTNEQKNVQQTSDVKSEEAKHGGEFSKETGFVATHSTVSSVSSEAKISEEKTSNNDIQKQIERPIHKPVNGEMLYAKYRGISKKNHNLLFETPDGDFIYVNSKYATQDFHLMKKNAWFWVERGKKIDQDSAGDFGKYIGKMLPADGNVGQDAWRFCQFQKVGDIIICPIYKKTPASVLVSLGPNYYAVLKREDFPLGFDFSSIEVGTVYKFEITDIRKDDKHTKVSLRIISKLSDFHYIKMWRKIPENIEDCFDINYERYLEYLLRDEVLFSALKEKLGGIITPSLLRHYIGEQYRKQKQDNTLVVRQNARGISIDIDLDVKNKYGAPIKAGINQKADRINDFYLALIGAVDPGSDMERFVYIEDWDNLTKTLADMALPEDWDYGDNSGRSKRHILAQYLRFNFYKARLDHDLYEEHGEALFNTGLVDTSYDDIFCYLKKNTSINDPLHRKWTIGYFACRGKGTNGKALNALFQDFPEPPQYITPDQLENLFFNTSRELACDYDHIIIDNMDRLPMAFISHRLAYDQTLRDMIAQGKSRADIEDYICDSPGLVKTLEDGLKSAVDIAVKFCKWNYKTAIPIYYAKTNAISLLLPLKLTENAGNADIALVVEKLPNGNYQGQTILTMEMAYLDARQICRPNSDWLTLQNVQNAEPADEEINEADDFEEE